MSLTNAIQIGRSALAASQIGIQVAGNNMANAATPGFSRQVARYLPIRGDRSIPGIQVGNGVMVRSVQRQVDMALQGRLWNGGADLSSAATKSNIFSQIEAALGELGDNDLSSELTSFFNGWSERANQTQSSAAVVQQGDRLAGFVRDLRTRLLDQRRQIDDQIGATVEQANVLLNQISGLNTAISNAEASGAMANTLRDQRDSAVTELSALMDVTVVDHGQQGIDILVGSTPVLMGTTVRPLELKRTVIDGEVQVSVATQPDHQSLTISSGSLGALVQSRGTAVDGTLDKLDRLASQLIFEVNKLHSTGVNASGLTSTTGTLAFGALDRARPLNDPANQVTSALPYAATHGSFTVRVRNESTGTTETVRINIDLDGRTNAGTPGTADDTTPQQIADALNAIPGLTAGFTPDGKLQVTAASGVDFSFADDTSGAVALLGLNAYFSGTNSSDIAVRTDLKTDPSRLTTGRIVNGTFIENGTALEIAGLQSRNLASLEGRTLQGLWRESVQEVGGQASSALTSARAAAVVYDSLEAQRAGISGVSIDEESINLMDFQRQYQAAARVINTANELTNVLMGLI
jgi:flagellar hook-associated protein 1 FlgK